MKNGPGSGILMKPQPFKVTRKIKIYVYLRYLFPNTGISEKNKKKEFSNNGEWARFRDFDETTTIQSDRKNKNLCRFSIFLEHLISG